MMLICGLSDLCETVRAHLAARLTGWEVARGYFPRDNRLPPASRVLSVELEEAAFYPAALGEYLGVQEQKNRLGRLVEATLRFTLYLPPNKADEAEADAETFFEILLNWSELDWQKITRQPLCFEAAQQALALGFTASLEIVCLREEQGQSINSLALQASWKEA